MDLTYSLRCGGRAPTVAILKSETKIMQIQTLTKLKDALQSIYARCLLITAVTTTVVAVGLILHNNAFATKLSVDGVVRFAKSTTETTMGNLIDPVNIGNVDGVAAEMARMKDTSENLLQASVVVTADRTILFETTNIAPSVSAQIDNLVSKTLETGATEVSDTGLIIAQPIFLQAENRIGTLITGWDPKPILDEILTDQFKSTAISLAALVLLLIGSTYLLNVILNRPLKRLENAVKRVSEGDFDTSINGVNMNNEVGRLAVHLENMKSNLAKGRAQTLANEQKQVQERNVIQALQRALQTLAKGDLTVRLMQALPHEYEQLGQDLNNTSEAFLTAMRQVIDLATNIQNESQSILQHSDDLSQRTENQAATLEETAAALDELTNGIQNAAAGARESAIVAQAAQDEADQSGQIVQSTVTAMDEIAQSSSQISDIISVIDDIAFQTNLLALNAGVEAARAGDAGRGFAVVASEVRALAGRSSEAAKEIKDLIDKSTTQVSRGVKLVAQAGDALTGITGRVEEISTLMEKMAHNATDQSSSLDEINVGVSQLDLVTQRNAGMVEESTRASRKLLAQSKSLFDLVGQFQTTQSRQPVYQLRDRVA